MEIDADKIESEKGAAFFKELREAKTKTIVSYDKKIGEAGIGVKMSVTIMHYIKVCCDFKTKPNLLTELDIFILDSLIKPVRYLTTGHVKSGGTYNSTTKKMEGKTFAKQAGWVEPSADLLQILVDAFPLTKEEWGDIDPAHKTVREAKLGKFAGVNFNMLRRLAWLSVTLASSGMFREYKMSFERTFVSWSNPKSAPGKNLDLLAASIANEFTKYASEWNKISNSKVAKLYKSLCV